jgi:hypothetical protein
VIIYGRGFSGLGQDDSGLDLSAYSDQSTISGLPVYAELGLGILGLIVLSYAWGGAKSVSRSVRSYSRKRAQRKRLKAGRMTPSKLLATV